MNEHEVFCQNGLIQVRRLRRLSLCFSGLLAIGLDLCAAAAGPERLSAGDLIWTREILRQSQQAVEENYFSPQALGDLAARSKATQEALAEAANREVAFLMIEQIFSDLNDSGTRFEPTLGLGFVDYGWTFLGVGDEVLVNRVAPKSDAETKGLRRGDRILRLNGMEVRPDNWRRLDHVINYFALRRALRVVAQSPGAEPRELLLAGTQVKDPLKRLMERDPRKKAKMPLMPDGIVLLQGSQLTEQNLNAHLRRMRKATGVILDLRGSGILRWKLSKEIMADWFEGETRVFTTRRLRTEPVASREAEATLRDPAMGLVRGTGRYSGPLMILVDQSTRNTTEVMARFVQLARRGRVVGDRTPGHGCLSEGKLLSTETPKLEMMSVTITVARYVMPDGVEIEDHGVVPDEVVIPTHEQLYRGHDPVLARALALLGHPVTAEEAGRFLEQTP